MNNVLPMPAPPELPSPEKQPKLRITLYPGDGVSEVYENCVIGSGLAPELEFHGDYKSCVIGPGLASDPDVLSVETVVRRVHITATTLPYKIEEVK